MRLFVTESPTPSRGSIAILPGTHPRRDAGNDGHLELTGVYRCDDKKGRGTPNCRHVDSEAIVRRVGQESEWRVTELFGRLGIAGGPRRGWPP
jgi:hypothetical protein